MKWFTGEVSSAIQKAISERKVFIVFVKDDAENSSKMEEIWNDDQIAEVCTDNKCVAISILAGSVPGQQFGAIYPIMCVPSTYLINNQGIPTDIIPGLLVKEEFLKRLNDAIDKTLSPSNTESTVSVSAESTGNKDGEESGVEKPTMSSSPAESHNLGEMEGIEEMSILNDDLEAELTPQEKTQIEMLREKVKLKREEEEKQKLKEMEKKRRETSHELQMAQRDIAERQAFKLAKEISDRKSEDKAAREKVKEQIRQDRLDKTERFDREKQEREEVVRKKRKENEDAAAYEVERKKVDTSNIARLQFRLPDGSTVSNTFNSEAKFFLAQSFIQEHLQVKNVRLTTVYPKHEFNSEDTFKSFRELGLAPNASIIVSPARADAGTKTVSTFDPVSVIMFILSPIFAIFNWIMSLFTTSTSNANRSNQETSSSFVTPNNNRDDTVRRRNLQTDSSSRGGNMQSLRRDDDDENATWNGNSTQQM